MGLQRMDLHVLARTPGVTFFLPSMPWTGIPENVLVCTEETVPYHDLLAACDVIVMKPGYGTVADCLANRVPMVYSTRPGFEEEGLLVRAMHEDGRAAYLPTEDLYEGRIGSAIEAALSCANPWRTIRDDGHEWIARRLLAAVERGI